MKPLDNTQAPSSIVASPPFSSFVWSFKLIVRFASLQSSGKYHGAHYINPYLHQDFIVFCASVFTHQKRVDEHSLLFHSNPPLGLDLVLGGFGSSLSIVGLRVACGCSSCRVIWLPWRGSVSLLMLSHESRFKGKTLGAWVFVLIIAKSLCSPFSQLMSSNSSASLYFGNGDLDSNNQDTTICNTSKSPSPPPLGESRGDYSCHQTKKIGPTYAEAMKFGMGCSAHSAYTATEQGVGPTLPPSLPHPNPKDKALSEPYSPVQLDAIDADLNPSTGNLILAHLAQNIIHEEPANSDPLNAMDEDLLGEANDDDYEDSQALIIDEEEIADTFLNLDPI
ncbi:hypothetical protein Cgig2_014415 [Carnegiea gigantea]|uniref:Uncharacterized protein n=1 Tax=Carnegiea gigantea TaxID=171969 RepID=A0A9Q1JM99_9CARY|nr:hypothetical protein Cgig2_014415 [Carnegiea gigantea]